MKIFTGIVISTKMQKTAKVAIERVVAHPVYKKRVKRTRHYLVHDEMGAKDGQQVRFVASKPFSKMKRWKIVEIVGVGKLVPAEVTKKTEKLKNREAVKPRKEKKVMKKSKNEKGKN
jgi:small subunit ribosomal protein S17